MVSKYTWVTKLNGGKQGPLFKLNASSDSIWKPQVDGILYYQDLNNSIKGVEAKEDKEDKEWERMNRKTVGFIRQRIYDIVFHNVAQEGMLNSVKEITRF